jgi:hypothetical protein
LSQGKSKTVATRVSVSSFIAAVANDARRADAKVLVKELKAITGWKPQMWGPSIIGFGAYHYTYETGRTGSICAIGFSPRKASLVIYAADFPGKDLLLAKLGRHKGGIGQCLYINQLADVDMAVLRRLLKGGLAQIKKDWPVTAS